MFCPTCGEYKGLYERHNCKPKKEKERPKQKRITRKDDRQTELFGAHTGLDAPFEEKK